MPMYKNLNGDSGIVSYECGADWIEVTFQRGKELVYRYTYASAGSTHVEQMKRLAQAGTGLNEYINKFVAKLYASKH